MTKEKLYKLIKEHGGIRTFHTHPCGCGGWCNTIVCADGYSRTLTLREERWVGEAAEYELGVVH